MPPKENPVVEPTGFATPANLSASADAWYERTTGKRHADNVSGWQTRVAAHEGINKLPLHKRLWKKMHPDRTRFNDRDGIAFGIGIIVVGLFLRRDLLSSFQYMHGAILFAIAMIVACLWDAESSYRKTLSDLKHCLSQSVADSAKPAESAIIQDYLGRRLVTPRRLTVTHRLENEGAGMLAKVAELAALDGLSLDEYGFTETNRRRAVTMRMVDKADAIVARLGDHVRKVREEVTAPAPSLDDEVMEDAENLPTRLKRLLPEINEALWLISLLDDAIKEPSLKELLEHPSWLELEDTLGLSS